MNNEVKTKWLKALRSGEYVQGKGILRGENKYCCLGVLCDIAFKAGIGYWSIYSSSTPDSYITHDAQRHGLISEFGTLPKAVYEWAELHDALSGPNNPTVYGHTLSYYNDYTCNFEEIADLIEKGL